MKTFKQKLIDHGYPKSLVVSWGNNYCMQEWKELMRFVADNRL